MNTHVMHVQREINLKPFMQKYPFLQATGAYYRHLDQVDGKVQIETLEALRSLTKFKTGRYGRSTRYGHFAQLVAQMESELMAQKDADLFA